MRHAAAGAVLLALLAASPATAATHVRQSPDGMCSLHADTDPTMPPWTQAGTVSGGPVLVPAPYETYEAHLVCTVQINGSRHDDEWALGFAVASGTSRRVVALGAFPGQYEASPGDTVFLCTRLEIHGGPTLYRTGEDDLASADVWTTDPSSGCAVVASIG